MVEVKVYVSETRSRKSLNLPFCFLSWVTCCRRSQLACHEDLQGVLWRDPVGKNRGSLPIAMFLLKMVDFSAAETVSAALILAGEWEFACCLAV